VVQFSGSIISAAKVGDGKLTFDRLDDSLPFSIPDEARSVLPMFPTILDLSHCTLKVTGLKGEYDLKINGVLCGIVAAEELEKGVNLTNFAKGPIADQGKQVLAAVSAKEALVGQWRGIAKAATAAEARADVKEKFGALTKEVEDADSKIRNAAKPKTLYFELSPAK
jgi:hypothetical protein